jgi:hypothetical protein
LFCHLRESFPHSDCTPRRMPRNRTHMPVGASQNFRATTPAWVFESWTFWMWGDIRERSKHDV